MKKSLSMTSVAVLLVAVTLIGAGCQKKTQTPATSQGAISNEQGPADPWKEYQNAKPVTDGLAPVTFGRPDGTLTISVPKTWKAFGATWQPTDAKIDHIRVAHFSSDGPMTAWDAQKKLDVHVVVDAEQKDGRYFLMVNHPSLQASILKVFIPDPASPGTGYYFFECRAGYKSDRTPLWNACKAAYNSLTIK